MRTSPRGDVKWFAPCAARGELKEIPRRNYTSARAGLLPRTVAFLKRADAFSPYFSLTRAFYFRYKSLRISLFISEICHRAP